MAYQPAWLRRLSALRQAGPPHLLVDRVFDSTYDFPPTTHKRFVYLIATTPRSGSHYLGHLLFSTKQLGAPLEYLSAANFDHWCELVGSTDPRVVYGEIMTRRTSPNGWFGLQAHWYHLANLARFRIPRDLFDVQRIIWIVRRDASRTSDLACHWFADWQLDRFSQTVTQTDLRPCRHRRLPRRDPANEPRVGALYQTIRATASPALL